VKVVYSIPTRIGASGLGVDGFEALKGIYARGYLGKVVAYGNRQKEIPSNCIRPMRFYLTKIFSNLPARYYYPVKMKSLDRLTVRVLRKGADLFHGWSGSSLRSLSYCRERGIVSFLENPGPHFRYTEEIMSRECGELGIPWKKDPEIFKDFFGFSASYLQAEHDRADFIVLESDFTRDTFLSNGIGEEKLLVAPRGVDTNRFVPPPRRRKGTFRAIFVGAIGVRKGVRYILEAWSDLDLKDAELLLVGTVLADMRSILPKLLGRSKTVRIAGFVGDPVGLYQDASVFIFPSLSEGSAKVTYEAMACGLPVIVTPNAGSVARDGEHGIVVPVRDREALKQAILTLYENEELREELGRNARRHIEQYTWEHHRKTLIGIYEDKFAFRVNPRPVP
jgi:glycosyltransferase involved in cell wall biosynthesis